MKHSAPETLSAAQQASATDVSALAEQLRQDAEPYALATVVRTISVTAAKAGAKAVIAADGRIAGGWIGGGCARSAVIKAAKAAIEDGETKLISIQPEDLLAELGVEAGDNRQGVQFAKNMCPSQGTMDIFVEPVSATSETCLSWVPARWPPPLRSRGRTSALSVLLMPRSKT
jgi:xanthine dehydrogenase accessory factor